MSGNKQISIQKKSQTDRQQQKYICSNNRSESDVRSCEHIVFGMLAFFSNILHRVVQDAYEEKFHLDIW